MGLLSDAFNVVHGAAGVVKDVAELAGDIVTGDVHGAVTDAQKLVGDSNDVVKGLNGLGVPMGSLPRRFSENSVVQLADSPPIQAAQLVIEGMLATTGSGAPEDGKQLRDSAKLLEESVELLIDAKPHDDRWDGSASAAYAAKDDQHRRTTSGVQTADDEIRKILSTEANQVEQTRKTLDEVSQYLYDFALSTSWMNLVPGGKAAKLAVDAAAAGIGVNRAEYVIARLVSDSLDNASKIRAQLDLYNAAEKVEPPEGGACKPFVRTGPDGRPLEEVPPSRLLPNTPFERPEPVKPPQFGPPATPYRVDPAVPSPGNVIARPQSFSAFSPAAPVPQPGSAPARWQLPPSATATFAAPLPRRYEPAVATAAGPTPGTTESIPLPAVDAEPHVPAVTTART